MIRGFRRLALAGAVVALTGCDDGSSAPDDAGAHEATGVTVRVVPCPAVIVAAAPSSVDVGATIYLTATATVPDGGPVTIVWSAPSGNFGDIHANDTTFICTVPGDVTLTLTATFDLCEESRSVTVHCSAP
jgi:hypothetical protein